jgi:uncharacterized caspase-like protein
MRWHLWVLVLLFGALAWSPTRAAPDKRVALVIGVEHYRNAPALRNPVNDATLIGPALQKLQFAVQTVLDPDYAAMKRAIQDFARRLDGADVAVFFYSGHGLQASGSNYLLPVDVVLAREADLRYEAFDVQAVLDEMDASGRVNLVFLDACRDNPLSRSLGARMGAAPTRSARVLPRSRRGSAARSLPMRQPQAMSRPMAMAPTARSPGRWPVT